MSLKYCIYKTKINDQSFITETYSYSGPHRNHQVSVYLIIDQVKQTTSTWNDGKGRKLVVLETED